MRIPALTQSIYRLSVISFDNCSDISYFERRSSCHAQIPNYRIQEVFRDPVR